MPYGGRTIAAMAGQARAQPRSLTRLYLHLWILLAYGALRWLAFARANSTFGDSTGYHESSHYPIFSERFLAGRRSFPVPLFWKLIGDDETAITIGQLLLSVACWAFLAYVVASVIQHVWVRWAAFAYVLLFSLATPVVQWDRDLLSESVTLSLTALLFALVVLLVQRPTWRVLAAALAVAFLWGFARDSDTYAAVVVVPLLVALLVRRVGPRPQVAVALAAAIAIFVGDYASAQAGHRADTSLQGVVGVRLFVDEPSAKAWMTARGYTDKTAPNTISLYRSYLLHHPLFTLLGPLRNKPTYSDGPVTPGRLGALYTPHVGYEKSTPTWRLPLALQHVLLAPARPLVLGIWALLAAVAAGVALRVARPSRVWLVPVVAAIATYPQFAVVWNGDEHEVDRHALLPSTALRLSVALLLFFALDALTRRATQRGRSRPSPA